MSAPSTSTVGTPPLIRGDALTEVHGTIQRYIWRPDPWQYYTLALWIAHTHLIEAFDWSPVLHLTSPDGGYGKTQTLLLLAGLCRGGNYMEKVSAASAKRLFHEANEKGVVYTALLDEVRGGDGEWEVLLDIGVRRGARFASCVWEERAGDFTPKEYLVFGPKALGSIAGNGALTGTNESRAITLLYLEKGGQHIARSYPFDGSVPPDVARLRDMLTALATPELIAALRAHDTRLPPGRRNDTFRPLIAIGDLAGEPWRSRARDLLERDGGEGRMSRNLQALTDMVRVSEAMQPNELLPSKEAVARLLELEESPWAEQRLSTHSLARLMGHWGIKPQHTRQGRGYAVAELRQKLAQQQERQVSQVLPKCHA